MGISTMLTAKRIILIAWGEDKAEIVRKIVEEKISPECPASYLQRHENISFYVDENSASLLTRNVAPWLVGPCEWTPKFVRKAVVWLCEKVHKPILKLTQGDYLSNGLGELLEKIDNLANDINKESTTYNYSRNISIRAEMIMECVKESKDII